MIYLWLLIFTLSGPLAFSFERKIRFYTKWPALFPAITFTATYFLAWDVAFTRAGVWGFNQRYLLGPSFFDLPIEEIAFFFIIPYSCLFIYEALKYYVARDWLGRAGPAISGGLGLLLLTTAAVFHDRAYTLVTALGAGALLVVHGVYWRSRYLGRFYLAYLASLLPFFLVNGVLTGTFLATPVVWYDNSQNLGVRIGTIPVEDCAYMLLMLLSTTTLYEGLIRRPAT